MIHLRNPRTSFAALVVSVLALACSSGGSDETTSATAPPPVGKARAVVALATVASAGAPIELPVADRDAVVAAVATYVEEATLAPLEGKPVADVADLLAPSAIGALAGPERDALVDADIPKATARIRTTLAPVNLRGLADAVGTIDLVGATLDVTVRTSAGGGPLTIHRSGELMFTRDAGEWKILSFKLAVTRDGPALDAITSTTTAAP